MARSIHNRSFNRLMVDVVTIRPFFTALLNLKRDRNHVVLPDLPAQELAAALTARKAA